MTITHKKCIFCAEDIKVEALLCRFCGQTQDQSLASSPGMNKNAAAPSMYGSEQHSPAKRPALGLSVSGLVLGVIAIAIGLVDIGLVEDGSFSYVKSEEVGLLAAIAFVGLGLAIGAASKKQSLWQASLSVSILATLVVFVTASYS